MTREASLARFLALLLLVVSGCAGPDAEAPSDGGPSLDADPEVGETSGIPPGTGVLAFAAEAIPEAWESYRVTFTPSGDTAYFAAGDAFFPFSRDATIYQLVREGEGWGSPTTAPFSGTHPDIDPFVSPDGRFLYFSSIRPVNGEPGESVDLWRVPREGGNWGMPERLDASSSSDDLFPSVDRQGRLYFARPLPDPTRNGEWGIWVAEPRSTDGESGWEEAVPLGDQVNAPGWWSFNPAVTADGSLMLFTRLNPTDGPGSGFGELHAARRTDDGWGTPEPLGSMVNTPADEFHPSLSPDARTLYFVRRDPRVEGDRGRILSVPLAEAGF